MKYLLLHGLGQTASSWNSVSECLDDNIDTLVPDLTDLLPHREVKYSELYAGLSAYCAEFAEPVHLCGLSLGGILAMQYAAEHPAGVASLVLIGTQFVIPKKLLRFQNFIFSLMPNRMFKDMGFQKADMISLSKSMADLNFQQTLEKITCPVLILCGEKDTANKQAALQMKERIPHAEMQIIPGAGHEVNLDTSERLANLLNAFWGE